MTKYLLLLYTLPLPVVVFIWNSGVVDIDATSKSLFSIILVLLTVGGYTDVYRNELGETENE